MNAANAEPADAGEGDETARAPQRDAADPAAVADRLRDRAERVRRREFDTAMNRLAADGEATPAERDAVAALAAGITDALVEQWVSRLTDDGVDPEVARSLFTGRATERVREEE